MSLSMLFSDPAWFIWGVWMLAYWLLRCVTCWTRSKEGATPWTMMREKEVRRNGAKAQKPCDVIGRGRGNGWRRERKVKWNKARSLRTHRKKRLLCHNQQHQHLATAWCMHGTGKIKRYSRKYTHAYETTYFLHTSCSDAKKQETTCAIPIPATSANRVASIHEVSAPIVHACNELIGYRPPIPRARLCNTSTLVVALQALCLCQKCFKGTAEMPWAINWHERH